MPFFIKLKCCFCDNRNGFLQSVHQYGIYGEVGKRTFFHQECLEEVELHPEVAGHKKIDMAININDIIEENKRDNKKIIRAIKKKYKKLQRASLERMMPKRE